MSAWDKTKKEAKKIEEDIKEFGEDVEERFFNKPDPTPAPVAEKKKATPAAETKTRQTNTRAGSARKAEYKSLDKDRKPAAAASATSLVQVEGESSPKKVTTLIDDVTRDPNHIDGVEFTIQVPLADIYHTGQTYDQIVSNLKSEIMQFTERHNVGSVNFRHKDLKKFTLDEIDEDANAEHDAAAGPDSDSAVKK